MSNTGQVKQYLGEPRSIIYNQDQVYWTYGKNGKEEAYIYFNKEDIVSYIRE